MGLPGNAYHMWQTIGRARRLGGLKLIVSSNNLYTVLGTGYSDLKFSFACKSLPELQPQSGPQKQQEIFQTSPYHSRPASLLKGCQKRPTETFGDDPVSPSLNNEQSLWDCQVKSSDNPVRVGPDAWAGRENPCHISSRLFY
ncbi:hypothetical protein Bbelb_129310 [Branchiostoma belcheri]|nr:hypothetical protein Bbelb_129310 [Branchiostoma belcheri]